MTTAVAPVLVNGKPIRARKIKQVCWSVGLGTLLLGLFFSGVYDIGTQVHWVFHFWFVHFQIPWAKPGWDKNAWGLIGPHGWVINTTNWSYQFGYRHALRDIILPAFATMGALSIAGGAHKPASWLYTAIAPFLVLAVAIVLIIGGMWLTLRAGTGPLTGRQVDWLHLVESLLLGVGIGFILHRIWRPAGTRIQAFLVERLVDRFWRGKSTRDMPFWLEHELLPPTALEAAAVLIASDLKPGEDGVSEASRLATEGHAAKSTAIYWLAAVGCLLILAVDFVGFIGHIWVGVLHNTFPYLAP